MPMSRRESLKTLALGAGALLALPRAGMLVADGAAAQSTPPPGVSTLPATVGPFMLPPLGYAYDALEPFIDAQTMEIHHDKHHATYVNKLNEAVAGHADLQKMSVEQLLTHLSKVPAAVRTAVRNHGGGHYNHSLLWSSLKKDGGHAPTGELAKAINRAWTNFDAFQEKFNAAAGGVFGSGWAWLVTKKGGLLSIMPSPNQESPLTQGFMPLLGIDVWEHAYYLKYQNRRPEYVGAFAKVVDWDVISARYRHSLES
jgi:Fe-Mn family superoxide dismutase